MKVILNGRIVDESKALISVHDRGFLYGDSIFETLRAYDGKLFALEQHYQRLQMSAEAIRLTIPYSFKELSEQGDRVLQVNKIRDARVKVIVTRGSGEAGLFPVGIKESNTIWLTYPLDLQALALKQKKGIRLHLSSYHKIPSTAFPAQLKSGNYLANTLAMIEAHNAGADEAVLLTTRGYLSEGTGSNLFIYSDGVLSTPGLNCDILPGITRDIVIGLARKRGLKVKEKKIRAEELFSAEEIFMTGSVSEIVPVVYLAGSPFGYGKRGVVTRLIQQAYTGYVKETIQKTSE